MNVEPVPPWAFVGWIARAWLTGAAVCAIDHLLLSPPDPGGAPVAALLAMAMAAIAALPFVVLATPLLVLARRAFVALPWALPSAILAVFVAARLGSEFDPFAVPAALGAGAAGFALAAQAYAWRRGEEGPDDWHDE